MRENLDHAPRGDAVHEPRRRSASQLLASLPGAEEQIRRCERINANLKELDGPQFPDEDGGRAENEQQNQRCAGSDREPPARFSCGRVTIPSNGVVACGWHFDPFYFSYRPGIKSGAFRHPNMMMVHLTQGAVMRMQVLRPAGQIDVRSFRR